MKFIVTNYSCLQNPCPQIPVLSVLCPQVNLLNPPPRTKFQGKPLLIVIVSTERLHQQALVIYSQVIPG